MIRPHVGVFALFSAVDYKAWYALAEFVDNSIQSFLDSRSRLEEVEGRGCALTITIETENAAGSRQIRVVDDAGGISLDRFEAAFQVATPPPDQSGLSVYGIGMKSAAAWFGDRFVVRSSALGEPVVRTIEFDFPAIIATRLDSLDVVEEPASEGEHFTELVISELHHPIQGGTHEKVRRHLASIYRSYLRSGEVRIFYNGEALSYRDPEILSAPYFQRTDEQPVEWRKDIDITLGTGERLHGFAALRKTADTKAAGFALFRRGRVITGIEDDPWRPIEIFGQPNKFPAQRLFGELQLENVKVSYSKNGFVWQAAEEELIARLRAELDAEPLPLLKQANGYRARLAEDAEKAAAARALDRTADALEQAAGEVISTELETDPPVTVPDSLEEASIVRERTIDLLVKGNAWVVSCELTNEDPRADWLMIADEDTVERLIQIRLNLAHPFSRRFAANDADDLEAMIRIAAAIALSVTVARMQSTLRGTGLLRTLTRILEGTLSRGA